MSIGGLVQLVLAGAGAPFLGELKEVAFDNQGLFNREINSWACNSFFSFSPGTPHWPSFIL